MLFGAPPEAERYEQVIDACALRADLDMLEDGDPTEIGARYGLRLGLRHWIANM